MTLKLDEFRLESYDERAALQYALEVLKAERPDHLYKSEVDALKVRLSRTQCQAGGCPYCGGEDEG